MAWLYDEVVQPGEGSESLSLNQSIYWGATILFEAREKGRESVVLSKLIVHDLPRLPPQKVVAPGPPTS